MSNLWLTDAEVDDMCRPLTQPAAQVRYLRGVLKLTVATKPNGRALVIRSHAEAALSGPAAAAASDPAGKPEAEAGQQPNRAALITLLQGGRAHGQTKKAQPA